MKQKQATREELVAQLSNVRASHDGWVTGDEVRRREISKMLGHTSIEVLYGSREQKVDVLSWPQIYFEIGKMSADGIFRSIEDNMRQLRQTVEAIQIYQKHIEESSSR